MSTMSYLKAYLTTSRSEYLLAEAPALFLIFFIGSDTLYKLIAPEVLEGVAVFILLYFVGFLINAYTDQEIDLNYTIFKNQIPAAVKMIGQKNILYIIAGQTIVAGLLTVHISWMMGSYIPMVLMGVGTFFGLGYSIPPLQFKVRGVMHAISLTLSAFLIPALFLLFVIAGEIALFPFILVTGFSILHYGIAFANQAIDYLEDKRSGVLSPPVRWGLSNSLRVALTLIAAGLVVVFAGLFFIVQERGGFSDSMGIPPVLLFVAFVPVVILGYYIPASGLWRMYRATKTRSLEDATNYMKEICHYNQWQASGIIGLALVMGILFFGGMLLS